MKKLIKFLKENKQYIAFMESCTGGFLSSKITNIPGASDVLKVSLITYSNEYKVKCGVNPEIIKKYTVYSKEVAEEMAKQVSIFANSDWGVGITGKLETENQEDNRVYYSIYNKNISKYVTKELIIKGKNREEMKEQISQSILKEIVLS